MDSMSMGICHAPLWHLEDACSRWFITNVVSTSILLVLVAISLPLPRVIRKNVAPLRDWFRPFLTLSEAEAIEASTITHVEIVTPNEPYLLTPIALVPLLSWLIYASYAVIVEQPQHWLQAVEPFVLAAVWLYPTIRPIARPVTTTPFDLFAFFVGLFLICVVNLGAVIFNNLTYDSPIPSVPAFILFSVTAAVCLVSLVVVLRTVWAIPSDYATSRGIGTRVTPEDYTSLWSCITFRWMGPMIQRGSETMLEEEDVYDLSITNKSRPVYATFLMDEHTSLLRKMFYANRRDLFFDFVLTVMSVTFAYASPFFLNRILQAFDENHQNRENISVAYVYALLSFTCLMLKGQTDVHHLWLGRRASTRAKMELMAAIYEQALKRRDMSGTVSTVGGDKVNGVPAAKVDKAKSKDEGHGGADVGRIMQLMSGDARKVSNWPAGAYFLYSAPFEIAIALTFLTQLLGWAAFIGFFILIITAPLNSYLTRRGVRVSKDLSAARDKRMSVINELVGAIQHIKFSALEVPWVERVQTARARELKWLVRERINSVLFSLLWSVSPVLVSVISFFTFTVIQGKQLTVPIAFTAIALFAMLRNPLNVIPTFIVNGLQAMVALRRIEAFLKEEQVPIDVSSLKRPVPDPSVTPDYRIGAKNASFHWMEVPTQKQGVGKAANGARDQHVIPVGNDQPTDSRDASKFELQGIDFICPVGELTVITGPTASGKSALLLALLGEMTLLPGGELLLPKNPTQVDENGYTNSITYCAQSPWLQHMSIRDNILFGSPFDEERYHEVIAACSLEADLAILEDGDMTEIGARGVTLSGGQKARVALARAAYSRAKTVLLDDIFAAVDSHTAHALWDQLIKGRIMKGRTIVLVTHHLDLVIDGAAYIVRLLDGQVDLQGTVSDLRERGLLTGLISESLLEAQSSSVHPPTTVAEAVLQDLGNTVKASPAQEGPLPPTKKARKLVKEEGRASGSVDWSVYKTYLQACSYWVWAVVLVLLITTQANGVAEKLWIRRWGMAYQDNKLADLNVAALFPAHKDYALPFEAEYTTFQTLFVPHGNASTSNVVDVSTLPSAKDSPMFYIGVYAAITIGGSLLSILGVVIQFYGSLNASRRLFTELLHSVLGAPLRWFDVTPTGRILNRFSRDIETIDSSLSGSIRSASSYVAAFIAAVLSVIFFVPPFIVPAVVIAYLYYRVAIGYIRTGRDLRRMDSNSKSPIYSAFGELLEGIITVRAFGAETRFFNTFHEKQDVASKYHYYYWMLNRWLLLRFDALGAVSILLTTLFALSGYLDAGTAGLTITSAMAFTASVYWTCRYVTELEMDSNAVERIVQYLQLPQEPPAIIEDHRPPAYWPSADSNSLLRVENLVIKYAPDLPPVINDVSFTLRGHERVGLVGRTGSGKSTLAMSFLRFVEPAAGKLWIDGLDISTIGLRDLRSRLTIIPQDAVLFSGTVRDNVDPFHDHSDEEVLDTLYRVQLITPNQYDSKRSSRISTRVPSPVLSVNADEGLIGTMNEVADLAGSIPSTLRGNGEHRAGISLDTRVNAGGTNFSQGQRQLIAMARALLRQSSIIIMDEATSSIDFKTDAAIQRTIREDFRNSLLITVAHRLRTVIDYDRLIVLHNGVIAEFDTPLNLIMKEGGRFREMCLKSGEFEQLKAGALAASQVPRE